ncbi:hypothetical protein P5G63_16530 [Aeromonas salmonicida]|uniref:hypothetical protein n=1 Tax=Aeromonas salmonicida TaxID=645 RepID=UPI002240A227|nr:hypothetical protein [Aeromonas salmonicida]MDF8329998.1 hypothetical protein [Aeromonas salmonicida]
MRKLHLALILLASLLLNLWQWQAQPATSGHSQPEPDAALRTAQCDGAANPNASQSTGQNLMAKLPGKSAQGEPATAQEAIPPNPELEVAISQWSQSSDGSVLIERLYDAEQGRHLTTVFDRLDVVEDVRGQVQELLRELYRLGFDHPDAYEQESQRIWSNISNLLGEDTRTRLEQDLYSGDINRLLEIQGRLAERGELLAPTQRQSLTRLLSDANQQLSQQESGDASTYLENQKAYTQRVLENSRAFLNPSQLKVLQEMLELDLVRQEVSVQMEAIYQHFQPAS